jgi:mono/diheme cytochrome c family protein
MVGRYHGRVFRTLIWTLALVACAAPRTDAPAAAPARRTVETPMSEPAEYDIDRISRAAGEAIFMRTGIGDPYKTGIPYPIFLALLRAFPQTLGDSTDALATRFGFLARAADPASDDADVRAGLPLGMHLTIDPITTVPFVVTNCALCHAERLRWDKGEALVIGLANKRVRIHAYDAAFAQITKQPGFTVEKLGRLAREVAAAQHIPWPQDYADALVAGTLAALRERATQRAELHARTAAALPGRVATIEAFVPALEQLSGKHIGFSPVIGWAKVPDVIGFRARTTLSWDASGEGPMDVLAVEADIAAGVRPAWFERHPFQGASLGAYLRQPAPRPTFPGPFNRGLAERGKLLFEQHCADCHGTYARDGDPLEYDEEIVALADIGTDPARANAATSDFERVANDPALTRGYTKFRRTFGYVPPVLTNVWTRAPYGHAGQWPSLAVLAQPPEHRPTSFVIETDAPYDLEDVGVATRVPHGELRPGEYLFDATKPGYSIAGHPFLAELGADAPAVIEYLKSL